MTEQQKFTFPMLLQQLDSLTLRDKQRFARRLHGVKKVKNPDAQQAIYQEMAKEIEQAAGKVVLREAARPAARSRARIDVPHSMIDNNSRYDIHSVYTRNHFCNICFHKLHNFHTFIDTMFTFSCALTLKP